MRKLNNKGQVSYFFMMITVVLVMMFFMIINIGNIFYYNMEVQNAADNAALSVATYRARILNYIGRLNREIGVLLYGGGNPLSLGLVPLEIVETLKGNSGEGRGAIRNLLDILESGISLNILGLDKSVGFNSGSDINMIPISLKLPVYGFCPQLPVSFYRNSYHKQTSIICLFDIFHFCLGVEPFRLRVKSRSAKLLKSQVSMIRLAQGIANTMLYPVTAPIIAQEIVSLNTKEAIFFPLSLGMFSLGLKRNEGVSYKKVTTICQSVLPAPPWPGTHIHKAYTEDIGGSKKSWLYAGNKFDKYHKITIGVTKKITDTIYGISLFGDMKWPRITSFASAATYNTNGPMFPLERSDEIKPVFEAYNSAKSPGWRSHLVPDFAMWTFWLFSNDIAESDNSTDEVDISNVEEETDGEEKGSLLGRIAKILIKQYTKFKNKK